MSRTPGPRTRKRRPDLSLAQFALGEREQLGVERAQAFVRERAAIRAGLVGEHPLLAVRIHEGNPVLVLVPLDLRDELEPAVERLDDRAVDRGDLFPQP